MIKRLLLAVALSCAPALAVPVSPITNPHVTFVDNTGSPCSGCTLNTYAAGTTNPLATYVDSTGTGQNTNPITLDVAGGANIWLGSASYKFILKDTSGTVIWTVDNVQGYISACSTSGCTFTGPVSGTTATFDTVTANTTFTGPIGQTAPKAGTFTTLKADTITTPQMEVDSLSGNADDLAGNINKWVVPSAFGVLSGNSAATVTASGSGASLTFSSVSDFSVNQGIMISHGGSPCGTTLGLGCPTAPTPTVTNGGAAGTASYSYRLACIDGLGGVGVAGAAGTNATGATTLNGSQSGVTLTGDYNIVQWTGTADCREVAIYRNNVLIAETYSGPSGTMTYNDVGVPAWTSRDIPSAPPAAALRQNYVGQITAMAGSVVTVSPALTSPITSLTTYHSDTPLFQKAIARSKFVQVPPGDYLINYPINYTDVVRTAPFNYAGIIDGPGNLYCDTGGVCLDVTGSDTIKLSGFSMNTGLTNPSSINIYCSRSSTTGGFAQNITTDHLEVVNGATSVMGTSRPSSGGGVIFYNHACEIQHNYDDIFQAHHWFTITANNVYHVSSPFDVGDILGSNSMSQIDSYSMSGFADVAYEFDDAFSVNIIGGYVLGANNNFAPWPVQVDPGITGKVNIQGWRVEVKGGLIDVSDGGNLQEWYVNEDVYRSAPNLTLPQIRLNGTSSISNADMIRVDDYGGSAGSISALIDGNPATCHVFSSVLRLGVWETPGSCPISGAANSVSGFSSAPGVPAYDWSIPADYITGSTSSPTWIKMGTWVTASPGDQDSLGLTLFAGTGNTSGANNQSYAVINIRNANGTAAPNLSGADAMVFGAPVITGVKIAATGGSTSPTNRSWDVYVNTAIFGTGTLRVDKSPSAQWISSQSVSSDPGTGPTIISARLIQSFTGTCAPTTTATVVNGIITGCI